MAASRAQDVSDELQERPSKRPRVDGEGRAGGSHNPENGAGSGVDTEEEQHEGDSPVEERTGLSRASDLYLDTVREHVAQPAVTLP